MNPLLRFFAKSISYIDKNCLILYVKNSGVFIKLLSNVDILLLAKDYIDSLLYGIS